MSNTSNVNVNRQGPEVFKDNESGYHDTFTTAGRDYKPPLPKPIDWRVYAVWGIVAMIGFVVFMIVYGIWKWLYCRSFDHYDACQRISAIEPFAFGLVFFGPLIVYAADVLLRVWTRTRYENAMANRANLVLNRFGDQMPADLYDRLDTPAVMRMLLEQYHTATALESRVARHKVYRGVNTLSLSNTTNNAIDGAEANSETGLVPLTPDQWLPVAYGMPHIMVAGSTGEGKTITAKAALLARLQAGESIFIIDPHSSNWYGIAGRAGGENWADCRAAIGDVFGEYKYRINERHQYLLVTGSEMSEDHFPRLNVLVDEAFLIKENLDTGTSKRQVNYWSLLAEIMSSGARKIGISLLLLTQTANVEDLGISGPLRRNFFRIAVDAPSIRTMIAREETDHARKLQLYEGMIGMEYPATAEIDGQVYLLDRLGLLPMAQMHIDAKSKLWLPPAGRNAVPVPEKTADRGQNGQNDGDGDGDGAILQELVALRRQGLTREEARVRSGIEFRNDLWTIAGSLLGEA